MTVQVRSVVSLVAVMSVGVLFAADIQLKAYSSGGAYSWNTASIWDGGVVPNQATDTANLLVPGYADVRLMLTFNGPISLDAVTAGPNDGYYRVGCGLGTRVAIRDYAGLNTSHWPISYGYNYTWNSCSLMAGLDLMGTVERPSTINKYFLATFPWFGVPSEGGCGRISRFMGGGMFGKDGVGELIVGGPIGLTSGLIVNAGPIVIAATEEPRSDCPAEGSVFHVDASLASSLLTYEEGGRTYVTNWLDATGNGMYAKSDNYKNGDFVLGTPYLADHTVNGHPLVDFGKYFTSSGGTQSETEPASWMEWRKGSGFKEVSGICEMFLALESKPGSVAPIGHNSNMALRLNTNSGCVLDTSFGDVRIDGAPFVERYGCPTDMGNFHIVSVALKSPTSGMGGWFGRSGSFAIVGGFRLGEAIVYTNTLTEAERRQTIAYLKQHWMPEKSSRAEAHEWDLGDLVVGTNATSIKVAETDVARVRRIRMATDRSLIKEGSGTLAVDRVEPANAPVIVNGGSIRFTDNAGPAKLLTAMPDNPIFHFDATASSFDLKAGSETEIEAWHDCRVGSEVVAAPASSDWELPQLDSTGSPTGLPVVKFPTPAVGGSYPNAPRLVFQDCNCHEGFIVWKCTTSSGSYAPQHFSDYGKGYLAFRTRKVLLGSIGATQSPTVGGAVWSVNGQVINPFDDSFDDMGGNSDFVVIHFTSPTPILVNAMAALNKSYGGGCAIGEMVGYDRLLTDAERRGAEAYLMKRWLGKEHPDNIAWAGTLTFGADAEAVIDTACDIAPATLATSSATLTKKGLGTATVGAIPSTVESLSFDFDAEGKVGGLAVAGEYEAPATMSVTLTLPSEEVAQSLVGTAVRLIGAESVTDGANVAGWTLNAVNCGRVVCRLTVRADGVYATFSKPGLMLLLR